MQSIPSPQSTSSPHLRLLRDEDAPTYDADPPTVRAREPFVMVSVSVGETILGTLGPAAFAVYWHLAKRSKDGKCWPSLDDIAEATMLSRKHVTRMLDALERDGWIYRERRSNAFGMATSTLYTLVEKPRTDGCDMTETRPGHDTASNVTRTRVKPELNKKETSPLPPAESNGHAEKEPPLLLYRQTIGETTWARVAAQFKAISPSLGAAWFAGTMADAEVTYGAATRSQLEEAVKVTLNEVQRRLNAEQNGAAMVGNIKGWSRAVFEANLRDALGVASR